MHERRPIRPAPVAPTLPRSHAPTLPRSGDAMTPLYGFHRPSAPAPDATVAPLQARDIGRLSLGWSSHYSPRELEQHLLEHPGLSWWVPATGEYLIGGPWRHRAEIAAVQEPTARLQPEALVAAL